MKSLNLIIVSLAIALATSRADAVGPPSITYQGLLKQAGNLISGLADFEFRLFDGPGPGALQIGSTENVSSVSVGQGLFAADLDFGMGAFNGAERWLEIAVRFPAGAGVYTTLIPRQRLAPAPYALFAVAGGGFALPFIATASSSTALLGLTQTGDGPAGLFKVQPQPEPPSPSPALEAISAISSPALRANNTGSGSAIEAVSTGVGTNPDAPTILATNLGDAPAAVFGIDPHFTPAPALRASNTGLGSAIEAVSGQVGPPDFPTIMATNNGSGSAIEAVSQGVGTTPDLPAVQITSLGNGPALDAVRIGVGTTPDMPAIRATNNGIGSAIEAVSGQIGPPALPTLHAINLGGGAAGLFQGDVHIDGDLTRAYSTGTFNSAAPLAYAYINADGTIGTGTPNFMCNWDAANSRYVITIAGESYSVATHLTIVTPRTTTGAPFVATTNASGGQLLVRVYNLSGTPLQNPFQFMTYKP